MKSGKISIHPENRNYYETIAEFGAKIIALNEHDNTSCDDIFSIYPEIRISSDTIYDKELGSIDISIVFAHMHISLQGLKIPLGRRLGDGEIANEHSNSVEVTRESDESISKQYLNDGTVKAHASMLNLGYSSEFHSQEDSRKHVGMKEIKRQVLNNTHIYVKSKPGNRWIISEPCRNALNKTYLDGTKELCKISKIDDLQNMYDVTIRLSALQKDINVEFNKGFIDKIPYFGHRVKNKDKIMKILVAKSLGNHNYNNYQYNGVLILSNWFAEIKYD